MSNVHDPERDTYTAGTSPDAPTLRYRGVTIQTQPDLTIWIKTSPTDTPQCTVGPMLGRDLVIVEFNGHPITLNEELWSLIEVLPRGRDLYDRTRFGENAPDRKKKGNLSFQLGLDHKWGMRPEEEWDDGFDRQRQAEWDAKREDEREGPRPEIRPNPMVAGAYVGWSMYGHGAVFLKPARRDHPTTLTHVASASFDGNEFKMEPLGSVTGRQTILHHSLLVRGNLIPLKMFVNGNGTFAELFRGGHFTLEEIRQQSVNTLKALYRGSHVIPIMKWRPLTDEQFEYAAAHLDEPVFRDRELGPDNPPWRDVICDASMLRRGGKGLSGFCLQVPLLKTLNIPQGILKELRRILSHFPNDNITEDDSLHALFVWYGLMHTAKRGEEESVEGIRKGAKQKSASWTVPYEYLVRCILAWPHYLRWHEEMGFSEYIHFFRYVDHIFRADQERPELSTQGVTADVELLERLMLDVTSKVPNINPQTRLSLLPHMIPDSKMPRMINMEPYVFPSEGEIILSGLTSVYLKGLPCYSAHSTPPDITKMVTLCVPTRLAINSHIGSHRPLAGTNWDLDSLRNTLAMNRPADENETLLITAPWVHAGPVWRMDHAGIAEMVEDPSARGPAPDSVDPSWSLLDQLSVPSQATYLRQMWASLKLLHDQGVAIPDNMSLTLDRRGMPILIGGLTMTEELLRQPTLTLIHGKGGEDQLKVRVTKATFPRVVQEESEDDPTPLGGTVMEIISRAPQRKHATWKKVYDELAANLENGVVPTRGSLAATLEASLSKEDGSWLKVRFLGERNNETLAANLATHNMDEIMGAMYNLIGLETDSAAEDPLSTLRDIDRQWANACQELMDEWHRLRDADQQFLSTPARRAKDIRSMWSRLREKLTPGRLRPLLEGTLSQLKMPNPLGGNALQIPRLELRVLDDTSALPESSVTDESGTKSPESTLPDRETNLETSNQPAPPTEPSHDLGLNFLHEQSETQTTEAAEKVVKKEKQDEKQDHDAQGPLVARAASFVDLTGEDDASDRPATPPNTESGTAKRLPPMGPHPEAPPPRRPRSSLSQGGQSAPNLQQKKQVRFDTLPPPRRPAEPSGRGLWASGRTSADIFGTARLAQRPPLNFFAPRPTAPESEQRLRSFLGPPAIVQTPPGYRSSTLRRDDVWTATDSMGVERENALDGPEMESDLTRYLGPHNSRL
ncbi:hypothetical protein V8C40DRAFT_30922 [Trichoderma camerunense]